MKERQVLFPLFFFFYLLQLVLGNDPVSLTASAFSNTTLTILSSNVITLIEAKHNTPLNQIHIQNRTYDSPSNIIHLQSDQFAIVYGSSLSIDLIDYDGHITHSYQSDFQASSSRSIMLQIQVALKEWLIIGWSYFNRYYLIILNENVTQMSQLISNEISDVNLLECIKVIDESTDVPIIIALYAFNRSVSFQLYKLNNENELKSIKDPISINIALIVQSKSIQMTNELFITCSLVIGNESKFISCNRLIYSKSTEMISISLSEEQDSIQMIKDNGLSLFSLCIIDSNMFVISILKDPNTLLYQFIDINLNKRDSFKEIKLEFKNSIISSLHSINYFNNGVLNMFYISSDSIATLIELNYPICSRKAIYINKGSNEDITTINFAIIGVYKEGIVLNNDNEINIVFTFIPDDIELYYNRSKISIEEGVVFDYPFNITALIKNKEDKYVLTYYLIANERNTLSTECSIELLFNSNTLCDISLHLIGNHCFKCPDEFIPIKEYSFDCFPNTLSINKYYYDQDTNQFDLCYQTCKSCSHSGSELNHQCSECNEGFFPIANNDFGFNCHNPLNETVNYYYFNTNDYQYLKCANSCLTCYNSPIETDTNCIQCNIGYIQDPYDNTNCYQSCSPFYWFITQSKYQCTTNLTCPNDLPILNTITNQCVNACPDQLYQYLNVCLNDCPEDTIIDKANHKCIEIISLDTIEEVLRNIIYLPHQQLLKGKGFNVLIYNSSTENIEEMKAMALSENVSYIDFKECIHVLKHVWNVNHNDDLLIAKFELKRENETTHQVEYNIFSQLGQRLDLSICHELNITVNYALSIGSDIFLDIAHRMWNKSGIDIYNMSAAFFADYCMPFTSDDSTDVVLSDRRQHYFKNISFCEENCSYLSIDLEKKRVECICPVKTIVNETITGNNYPYALEEEDELTSSNYLVIVCYHQVFDLNILKINIGNYIFIVLIIMQLIVMIKSAIRSTKAILGYLVNTKPVKAAPAKRTKSQKNQKVVTNNMNIVVSSLPQKKKATVESFKTVSTNASTQKKYFINKTSYNNFIFPSIEKSYNTNSSKLFGMSHQRKKPFESLSASNNESIKLKGYTPDTLLEYTEMSYEKALNRDKRKIVAMYINIIFSKHIILCLLNKNDIMFYKSIKFSVFVLSTATDFFFNAFFYSDDYIKRRFISKGEESFWITVPKSILSYLITALITVAMEYLTETKIPLSLQSRQLKQKLYRKCNTYLRQLRLKLVIYFVIDWILMIFYWYYVSAFCGVYQNSQMSWLLGTLLSFGISMVTPFFTSFGIALLRYCALKCKFKWIFKISNILWTII